MEKAVIVIGTDHYNTLWLIRSLGMMGIIPFVIIQSPSNKSFVVKSRYCREYIIIESEESIISFLSLRNTIHKEILLTSSDNLAKLLDHNYDLLSRKYIIQNCFKKQGQLSYWMNKDNMLKEAKRCGMTIPESYLLCIDENVDISKIKYPCLLKPELSAVASKDNFRICNNHIELTQAIQEIKYSCQRVIMQEYIEPEYEYLVYGVSTEEEICLPGGLRKIHTCSSLNNLGMMSYSMLSDEIPEQIGCFDRIKNFIRSIGYVGVFSVEFMITKEKAYFLEVNLRNDGTCYITTQAGVNMPGLWVYSSLNLEISSLPHVFKRKYTYGMNEVNYLKYTLKSQSLITSFREICKVKAFSLCKYDDMLPVFAKLFYGIRKFCSNKCRI